MKTHYTINIKESQTELIRRLWSQCLPMTFNNYSAANRMLLKTTEDGFVVTKTGKFGLSGGHPSLDCIPEPIESGTKINVRIVFTTSKKRRIALYTAFVLGLVLIAILCGGSPMTVWAIIVYLVWGLLGRGLLVVASRTAFQKRVQSVLDLLANKHRA